MRLLPAALTVCLLLTACGQAVAPAAREKIAQDLQTGKLKPDAQGVVRLPPDSANASIGGRAFITTNRTGSSWVLLRTWRGKGANLEGYLYAPGQPLKVGSEVDVTTDAGGVIVTAEVTIKRAREASWYAVYSGND